MSVTDPAVGDDRSDSRVQPAKDYDDRRGRLYRVAYDEVQRVAGNEWVDRLKARETQPNSASILDRVFDTVSKPDREVAPDDIRRITREYIAQEILHFDETRNDPHPDYEGRYDPTGRLETEMDRFLEAVRESVATASHEEIVVVWYGEVEHPDGSREQLRSEMERVPAVSRLVVVVYDTDGDPTVSVSGSVTEPYDEDRQVQRILEDTAEQHAS